MPQKAWGSYGKRYHLSVVQHSLGKVNFSGVPFSAWMGTFMKLGVSPAVSMGSLLLHLICISLWNTGRTIVLDFQARWRNHSSRKQYNHVKIILEGKPSIFLNYFLLLSYCRFTLFSYSSINKQKKPNPQHTHTKVTVLGISSFGILFLLFVTVFCLRGYQDQHAAARREGEAGGSAAIDFCSQSGDVEKFAAESWGMSWHLCLHPPHSKAPHGITAEFVKSKSEKATSNVVSIYPLQP